MESEKAPIEQFHWCLNILRTLYKIIAQDIFQLNYRRGILFYVIVAFWLTTDICYLTILLFDRQHYDTPLLFIFVGMLIGASQVTHFSSVRAFVCVQGLKSNKLIQIE